jgi:cation transporter-like permease
MNKKILGLAILLGILGLSQMGLAQFPTGGGDFLRIVENFFRILVGLIAIIAVIFIILGAFQFLTAGGNPEAATKAKQQIIYAVIGLFVAAAAWALVSWFLRHSGGVTPLY